MFKTGPPKLQVLTEQGLSAQSEAKGRVLTCRTNDLKGLFGISGDWFEDRIGEEFAEGIHTYKVGRIRLWNVALTFDRLVNWDDEAAAHRAACRFAESLPSNWRPKSKRSRS